jgi:hypothetical protein
MSFAKETLLAIVTRPCVGSRSTMHVDINVIALDTIVSQKFLLLNPHIVHVFPGRRSV